MNDYQRLVASALEATVIHSATAYSWFGKRMDDLPAETERAMTPATARKYLLHTLQSQLYSDFYCPGAATPARDAPRGAPPPRFTPFVQALSAANAGHGSREPGWLVRAVEDGQVVVERDGLRVWVRREEVSAPKGGLVPGAALRVRLPKELLNLFPGFYMVLGDEGLSPDADQQLVRFYWNLSTEGAARLVRAATARLNRARLPFRLKVVNEPERYTRCDAGVLYVRRADYSTVARLVQAIYREVVGQLKPATPAFTKPLAPGLGLAEDPGRGESFGTHRCKLLADAIIRAHELDRQSVDDRLALVTARFAEAGISLEAPFLDPGSADVYAFRAP
jgi:hypothetical protein